ncbi:hypothetical protein F4803DRAFT_111579 [Xylaria telfairii]|nr:hypothetical protein F4803DRAFT_111579 [Xylaria telfairii]
MQRDFDLTFEDIHESEDELLGRIEEIYQHAVLHTEPVQEELDLRFLTYSTATETDGILRLTNRGENVGERNYLAVSYTFEKFNEGDATLSTTNYTIAHESSATTTTRAPRAQTWVIHRALQFAKSRGIRYIWIDLECIDKDDPDDIESHLHIVHEIFHRSRYAIGLLSFCVHNATLLDPLQYITNGRLIQDVQHKQESNISWDIEQRQRLARMLRLFQAISSDKWFSRTWTLMERLSAPHMCLVLPNNVSLPIDKGSADLTISLLQLQQVRESLIECQKEMASDLDKIENARLREERLSVRQNIDRLCHLISEKFHVEMKDPPWHQLLNVSQITKILLQIEQCDNAVLSDRLLILGYLCGFSRRLKTTELNHPRFSYSTCVLVLLLANGWLLDVIRVNGVDCLWKSSIIQFLCAVEDQPGYELRADTTRLVSGAGSTLQREDGDTFSRRITALIESSSLSKDSTSSRV